VRVPALHADVEASMTARARTWAVALWLAVVVATLLLSAVRPGPGMEDAAPWAVGLLGFPVAAAVLLVRAPGNVIGRVLAVVATAAALDLGLSLAVVNYPDEPWAQIAELLTLVAAIVNFGGIVGLLHLFPTGQPLGPRHRLLLRFSLFAGCVFAVLGMISPAPVGFREQPNELAIGPAWTATAFDVGFLTIPVLVVIGVVVLVLRRRRADSVVRAQLKWFFAAAAFFGLTLTVSALAPEWGSDGAEGAAGVIVVLAFWSVPAAVVVAVVRYHLYDIDRIVSRTATYLVVAGVLASVYVGSVLLLQSLLPGASQLAVAGSTLAVAGLFAPVRTQVQRRLERRFNRAHYEAGAVTRDFARRLQQQIDLETIETDLVRAVQGTVQPGAVQMWLAPARTLGPP
jgi:hypothetical protein